MQAVPRQPAARLPDTALRLRCTLGFPRTAAALLSPAASVSRPGTVVVAADAPEAARLTGALEAPAARATTCVYYAAQRSPVGGPVLVLNGHPEGPLNTLCVPSDVAPSYAPPGAARASASTRGIPSLDDASLDHAVRGQLGRRFGRQVASWQRLAVYRIPFALPAQTPATFAVAQRPARLRNGLVVCGDHRDTASIQGAMVSGRRAAAAVRGVDAGPSCAP